jgi:hypothetical protein
LKYFDALLLIPLENTNINMGEALLGWFAGDSVVAHLNLRQGAKKTLTWTKGRELKTLTWNFQN